MENRYQNLSVYRLQPKCLTFVVQHASLVLPKTINPFVSVSLEGQINREIFIRLLRRQLTANGRKASLHTLAKQLRSIRHTLECKPPVVAHDCTKVALRKCSSRRMGVSGWCVSDKPRRIIRRYQYWQRAGHNSNAYTIRPARIKPDRLI